MRMLLLLLPLLGMATADCPVFLRGVDLNVTFIRRFDEAVDVACGRANYSSIFWSRFFYEQIIIHIINKTDEPESATLKPLFASLQEKFDALDGPDASDAMLDAKDIIDDDFERYRKLNAPKEPMETGSGLGGFIGMIFQSLVLPLSSLYSPDIAMAYTQTVKGGFGVVETAEMRQDRVDAAVRAIERVGLDSDAEKMEELFARLYILATDTIGLRRSAFDQFADWTENKWNSTEIGPLEIVPGVEVLYVQYQNLKNEDSKTFVDWVLASHAKIDEDILPFNASRFTVSEEIDSMDEDSRQEAMRAAFMPSLAPVEKQKIIMAKVKAALDERESEFAAICASGKVAQCFSDLKAEAKMEIIATFPEFFEYLNNMPDHSALTSAGMNKGTIEKNQLEMEGSGEGSGMF